MTDFFEQFIAEHIASGRVTTEQGEILRKLFGMLSSEQAQQLQEVLTREPRFATLLIDNIEQKFQAIQNGNKPEDWQNIFERQAQQLDEL